MTDQLDMIRDALHGHYDPVRAVGRGGMATVYLAQDVKYRPPGCRQGAPAGGGRVDCREPVPQ